MTANWVTVGSSSITTSGAPLPAAMALESAVEVFSAVPVLLNLTVMPGLAFSKSARISFIELPESQPQNTSSPLLAPLSLLLPQAARPTSVATAAVAAMTFLVLRMLSPSGPLELTCGWLAFFRLASGFRPVTSRLSSGCLWLPSDC